MITHPHPASPRCDGKSPVCIAGGKPEQEVLSIVRNITPHELPLQAFPQGIAILRTLYSLVTELTDRNVSPLLQKACKCKP